MSSSVAIIDYGMGNLRSVEKAVRKAGGEPLVSSRLEEIDRSPRWILPGVGAFGDAAAGLKERGLFDPVREGVEKGRPFLGICLGLQLLFRESEESPGAEGFGLLPGRVVRFPQGALKVPHVGWNQVDRRPSAGNGPDRLFEGIPEGAFFYFVHSYYAAAAPGLAAGLTEYGVRFASCVRRGPLFACQFHPEKSWPHGLRLLRNFLEG